LIVITRAYKSTVVSLCNFVNTLGKQWLYKCATMLYHIYTAYLVSSFTHSLHQWAISFKQAKPVSAMSFTNPHTLLPCYQHQNSVTHPLYNSAIIYTKEQTTMFWSPHLIYKLLMGSTDFIILSSKQTWKQSKHLQRSVCFIGEIYTYSLVWSRLTAFVHSTMRHKGIYL
jgi:hypothetical protein